MEIFKIIGIIGLLLITSGILIKKRKTADILYIFGGIFLGIYSYHLGDTIFIVLQVILTLAAIYDLGKIQSNKKSS